MMRENEKEKEHAIGSTKAKATSSTVEVPKKLPHNCAHCRKARTKCDKQYPSCRRCVRKGLTCVGGDKPAKRGRPTGPVMSDDAKKGAMSKLKVEKLRAMSRKQFWLVFDDFVGGWDHHDTSSECVDTVVDALVLARRIAENMKCVNIFWSTKLFLSLLTPPFPLPFPPSISSFFLFFLLFLFLPAE